MKKDFNEQFEQVIAHLGDDKMAQSLRNVPAGVGDTLTFTGETALINTDLVDSKGKKISYGAYKTAEGVDISFNQIARRGNGLKLTKTTFKEALEEFNARIGDEGYKVTVEKVKKVESSFGEGKQTYLIFSIEE